MKIFWIAAAAILCCFQQTIADKLDQDAERLALNLEQFIDQSLLPNDIRQYMNKLDIQQNEDKGKEMLDTVVKQFRKKYLETLVVVERLRSAVEASYQVNWWSPVSSLFGEWFGGRPSCCATPADSNSLNNNDPPSKGCELWSDRSPLAAAILSKAFEKTSTKNFKEYRWLKRQYFGSVEGITTIYPPLNKHNPKIMELNRRPWFTQALDGKRKQVVLIFDNTPSLYNSYWEWYSKSLKSLQNIAKSYISTLNPYDEIAVLIVAGRANGSEEHMKRFHHNFVHASFQNKIEIRAFIENIKSTGIADFVGTFLKALKFFDQEFYDIPAAINLGDHDCKEVVLITIGSATRHIPIKQLQDTIQMMNQGRVNPVGVKIRRMNGGDAKLDDLLESSKNPRDENICSFGAFMSFNDVNRKEGYVAWTFPYLDLWGLGQVVTTSSPVFQKGRFIGVVAVDTPLKSFFEERSSLKANKLSYTFLVDDAGHVISHPLLESQNDVDMNVIDITSLERGQQFRSVIGSMKRGESGQKTFLSERLVSAGNNLEYEAAKLQISTTYFWKKVPNTRYSIGVAFVGDAVIHLKPGSKLTEDAVLFHRFDLSPPDTPCNHYNAFASLGKPSLFLASRAFLSNKDEQSTIEDADDVKSLTNYLTNRFQNKVWLKNGIKEEIIAINHIQDLWTSKYNIYQSNILWRHFTTPNGVFQIFPGIQIPESYDPTAREWYQQSIAFKDQGVVISTPYVDPASHKIVITLAQAFYRTSNSYFTWKNDFTPLFGVSGVDVSLEYFYKMFLHWFPSCKQVRQRCHLLDGAGFMIVTNVGNHTNPHVNAVHENHMVKYHMTHIEPEISSFLAANNILKESNCSLLTVGCSQRTYQLKNLKKTFKHTFQIAKKTISFRLVPVKNTNSYLLIRVVEFYSKHSDCLCWNKKCIKKNFKLCRRHNPNLHTELHFCQGSYLDSYLASLPCVQPHYEADVRLFDKRAPSALPRCYDTTYKNIELGKFTGVSFLNILWIFFSAASFFLRNEFQTVILGSTKLIIKIWKVFYITLLLIKNGRKSTSSVASTRDAIVVEEEQNKLTNFAMKTPSRNPESMNLRKLKNEDIKSKPTEKSLVQPVSRSENKELTQVHMPTESLTPNKASKNDETKLMNFKKAKPVSRPNSSNIVVTENVAAKKFLDKVVQKKIEMPSRPKSIPEKNNSDLDANNSNLEQNSRKLLKPPATAAKKSNALSQQPQEKAKEPKQKSGKTEKAASEYQVESTNSKKHVANIIPRNEINSISDGNLNIEEEKQVSKRNLKKKVIDLSVEDDIEITGDKESKKTKENFKMAFTDTSNIKNPVKRKVENSKKNDLETNAHSKNILKMPNPCEHPETNSFKSIVNRVEVDKVKLNSKKGLDSRNQNLEIGSFSSSSQVQFDKSRKSKRDDTSKKRDGSLKTNVSMLSCKSTDNTPEINSNEESKAIPRTMEKEKSKNFNNCSLKTVCSHSARKSKIKKKEKDIVLALEERFDGLGTEIIDHDDLNLLDSSLSPSDMYLELSEIEELKNSSTSIANRVKKKSSIPKKIQLGLQKSNSVPKKSSFLSAKLKTQTKQKIKKRDNENSLIVADEKVPVVEKRRNKQMLTSSSLAKNKCQIKSVVPQLKNNSLKTNLNNKVKSKREFNKYEMQNELKENNNIKDNNESNKIRSTISKQSPHTSQTSCTSLKSSGSTSKPPQTKESCKIAKKSPPEMMTDEQSRMWKPSLVKLYAANAELLMSSEDGSKQFKRKHKKIDNQQSEELISDSKPIVRIKKVCEKKVKETINDVSPNPRLPHMISFTNTEKIVSDSSETLDGVDEERNKNKKKHKVSSDKPLTDEKPIGKNEKCSKNTSKVRIHLPVPSRSVGMYSYIDDMIKQHNKNRVKSTFGKRKKSIFLNKNANFNPLKTAGMKRAELKVQNMSMGQSKTANAKSTAFSNALTSRETQTNSLSAFTSENDETIFGFQQKKVSHHCSDQLLNRSMESIAKKEKQHSSSILTEEEQREFDEFRNQASSKGTLSSESKQSTVIKGCRFKILIPPIDDREMDQEMQEFLFWESLILENSGSDCTTTVSRNTTVSECSAESEEFTISEETVLSQFTTVSEDSLTSKASGTSNEIDQRGKESKRTLNKEGACSK